jgi:hypothetical protein
MKRASRDRALCAKQWTSVARIFSGGDVVLARTSEHDIWPALHRALDTAKRAFNSSDLLFSTAARGHYEASVTATGLGSMLVTACEICDAASSIPMYELHPALELVKDLLQTAQLPSSMLVRTFRESNASAICLELNAAVARARASWQTADFRKKKANFERRFNKNFAALAQHLTECANHWPDLLVVCAELGIPTSPSLAGHCLPIDQVRAQWAKTIRALRKRQRIVSHIWRLDHSCVKSFFFQAILFVPADSKTTIEHLLGTSWAQNTGGAGYCENRCAIAQHYTLEPSSSTWAMDVAEYLLIGDRVAVPRFPDGGRAFGRGGIAIPGGGW